jgi:hypothetical protein
MKTLFTILLVTICLIVNAQSKSEQEIRKLESQEAAAMLKGDTITLTKLWSPGYVVNNPVNMVVDVPTIKWLIRTGKIDYTSFDRIVEKITFVDNAAIVMGREVTTPEKNTENAGKTVTRRYTDVWLKTKNEWRLIARQATNVSVI